MEKIQCSACGASSAQQFQGGNLYVCQYCGLKYAVDNVVDNPVQSTKALDMARRCLSILERQASGWGELNIPAHLLIELESKRQDVYRMEQELGIR